MKFQATEVSCSAAGDYYQLYLGPEEAADDGANPFNVPGPYLMIQRQFEMFDGGRCHIESDNERYLGDFHVQLIEFSSTRLSLDIQRECDRHVTVTFALAESEFERVRSTAEVIFGLKEPDDEAL